MAKIRYYVQGSFDNGQLREATPEQTAIVEKLIQLFWGDDRSSRIEIRIKQRGTAESGSRCSADCPQCWSRVNHPDQCDCDGFSDERGGVKYVITRGKPRKRKAKKLPAEAPDEPVEIEKTPEVIQAIADAAYLCRDGWRIEDTVLRKKLEEFGHSEKTIESAVILFRREF